MELAAAVTLETGKSRTESIAEVQEAVDLIEAYCEQIERHGGFEVALGQLSPEETNQSVLRPFGVFGVIGPFNFPVALVTGMAAGALVAGNTVVLKPSEQTPLSGALVGEAFAAAGLPEGVVGLVHGGAATGRALAEGAIDGVVFTGSAEVGRALGRRFQEGPYARPGDHRDGRQEPGDRGRAAPTSTPPPPASPRPRTASRARSAAPARARSCSTRSTTSWSSGSRRAPPRWPSATRPTATRSPGR